MSEMVERGAKAIFDCSGYDDEINFAVEDWAPASRAAIAAMVEPTAEMISAALFEEEGNGTPQRRAFIEATWRAMIQAALK